MHINHENQRTDQESPTKKNIDRGQWSAHDKNETQIMHASLDIYMTDGSNNTGQIVQ